MDIKAISVESFRSHEKFEVQLAKLTVLTGPNGSGKSSVLEAPATVLVGENTWTRREGVKLPHLIKHGAKQAKVTVVGKRAISRIISQKGSKIVLDDKDSLTQFELLSNLKITQEQARAALITSAFCTLSQKDQKDSLFSIMGMELSLEDVAKHIPKEGLPTWTKIAKKWVDDHTAPDEEGGEPAPLPPVDIDKLYDFVFTSRRNYKAKSAPTSPRNEENDHLVKDLSEVSSRIAKANFEAERRKATDREIARIPELEKNVLRLASYVPAAMDDFETRNSAAIAEFEAADKKRAELCIEVDRLNKEVLQVEKLKAESGKKVVCPIGLDCPHDEGSIKSRKTYLIRQFEQKSREYDKATAETLEAQNSHTELLMTKKEAEQGKRVYEQAQADLEKAKELKKAMGKEPAPDLEALQKEKARIEQALKAAAAGAAKAEPDPTVDHLNLIVQALDVNGIKTTLIRKGMAAIEDEANATLSKFGPYSIRFFLDGEYDPVILHRGTEIRIETLSEGERLIVSLVIQDVFAQRSRVNLVVIDNADLLDPDTYAKFVRTAISLKSRVLVGLANEGHAQAGFPNHDGDGDDYRVVSLAPKAAPAAKAGRKKSSEDFL